MIVRGNGALQTAMSSGPHLQNKATQLYATCMRLRAFPHATSDAPKQDSKGRAVPLTCPKLSPSCAQSFLPRALLNSFWKPENMDPADLMCFPSFSEADAEDVLDEEPLAPAFLSVDFFAAGFVSLRYS